MTEELDRLGGGDARIGRTTVCCTSSLAKAAAVGRAILQPGMGPSLIVHDPRASTHTQARKSFPLTSCVGQQDLSILRATLGQVLP